MGVIAAVAVPLLLAAGLVALAMGGDGDDGPPSLGARGTPTSSPRPPMSPGARAWQQAIDAAFLPLTDRLGELIAQVQAWDDGTIAAAAFAADVERLRPDFERVRDAVAAVEPLSEQAAARDVYRDSAFLYLELVRLYGVAAGPDTRDLTAQLALSARRLRTLADRIYDRARTMLEPGFPESGSADEIRRPPEVPDWVAEGLAAGPPLAETPPAAAATPPQRQARRPSEPEATWLARVGAAKIPSGRELAEAIAAGPEPALRALANRFDAVAAAVWAGPDPAGDRERAALLALAVLVREESARLAQAATLLPSGGPAARLTAIARRLALLGERLEEPAVRGEPSGIDPALLSATGP